MRVFKFFILLIASFLILFIVFNKSIFNYLQQAYHKDYSFEFALFDVVNEARDNLLKLATTNFKIDLFEIKEHADMFADMSKDDLIYIKNSPDIFINFKEDRFSRLKDAKKYGSDFSVYELIVKHNMTKDKLVKQPPVNAKSKEAINTTTNNQDKINNATLKQKITLKKGDKVLLIGDSLMQGTGMFIIKELKPNSIKVKNIAKQSTGLAYKKFYNWQQELNHALAEDSYDAIVVLVGVNDYWDMINPKNKSKYLKFGTDEWNEVYSSRVKEILDEAKSKNVKVLWYQLPAVKKKSLNEKVMKLNEVMQDTLQKENYGIYVKTDDVFGEFKAYLRNAEGRKKPTRSSDGVHFTPYGYSLMAQKLLKYLQFDEQGE